MKSQLIHFIHPNACSSIRTNFLYPLEIIFQSLPNLSPTKKLLPTKLKPKKTKSHLSQKIDKVSQTLYLHPKFHVL